MELVRLTGILSRKLFTATLMVFWFGVDLRTFIDFNLRNSRLRLGLRVDVADELDIFHLKRLLLDFLDFLAV